MKNAILLFNYRIFDRNPRSLYHPFSWKNHDFSRGGQFRALRSLFQESLTKVICPSSRFTSPYTTRLKDSTILPISGVREGNCFLRREPYSPGVSLKR